MASGGVTLLCPVRGCGAPIHRGERVWACAAGHSFDRARSGYCNLLQPQDRRSPRPGDSASVAQTRRRLFAAGHQDHLVAALVDEVARLGLREGAPILDVGCGEGSLLAALAARHSLAPFGLDISTPAIDLAARTYPGATWIVANADRFLPYSDGSFAVILSLTARLNPEEFRRALDPGGRLIIAVPAPDDLRELRLALLGGAFMSQRMERAAAELAGHFVLERRSSARRRVKLDPPSLRDLLAASYRGARHRERERLAETGELEVTMSLDLASFTGR